MIIAHLIIIFANWKVLISSFFETHFKIKTSDNNLDTTAKVSGYVRSKQTCDDKKAPVRVILPFKDQRSANSVRRQLGEFNKSQNLKGYPSRVHNPKDQT